MGAAPADSATEGGRSAAATIAQSLAREIRSGEIPDRQPLPTERQLCDRFEASRPTVREALAQLQHRGYISGGQGRRPRATRPSLVSILRGAGDHLREVLGDSESAAHLEQMRHFIETGAAREAATRADTIRIAKLRDTLDRNFATIGTAAFPATDIAFHRAIVAVLGNPVILTLHDMFVSDMLAKRPPLVERLSHDRNVYEEHRQIYQAILDSDPDTATAVMDRHLARSYRSRLPAPQSLTPEP